MAVTVTLLAVLQVGPSLYIIVSRGLIGHMDWPGYTAYQLGSLIVPLLLGSIGLLLRRHRGLGYLIASLLAFGLLSLGSLAQL
ncbi:hypothetical protein [Gymnodinialimonas ceratoperidinii]|uniref:Uncharacterized protein n=1 Tax=Gymnodinialimonas ceratoperidinii TaxID=2856823 RepID=A0A8F6TYZ0_9RHOB|nr:hypothetical protein [Gymnodinialimonas ceratoperidinii]QXT41280.1 hypothetical protein KYE46_08740 [Gymnodinialimonas ceratoperidinii]